MELVTSWRRPLVVAAVVVSASGCTSSPATHRQASPASSSARPTEAGASAGSISPTPTTTPTPPGASASVSVVNEARTGVSSGWVLTTAGVLHTDDGGASWWGVALPGLAGGGVRPASFFATSGAAWVATVSAGAGVVSVFRVDDDGSTTTGALPDRVSKGAEVSLSVLDRQGGYAAVGGGRASDLYRTTDGGRTWAVVGRGQPFTGPIRFTSRAAGWALGGHLYRTVDGGHSWRQQRPPAPFLEGLPGRFAALSMFGQRGVLAVEIPSGMLGHSIFDVTSDGGVSWIRREGPQDGVFGNTGPPRTLDATDADHWVFLTDTRIWATSDAGLRWSAITTHAVAGNLLTASFADQTHGWASELPPGCQTNDFRIGCTLVATDDGGRSWQPVSLPAAPTAGPAGRHTNIRCLADQPRLAAGER